MGPVTSLGQSTCCVKYEEKIRKNYKMTKILGLLVFVLVLASQSVFGPVKGKNLVLCLSQCVQFVEKGLFR